MGQVDKPVGKEEDTDHFENLAGVELLDQVGESAGQLESHAAEEQLDHVGYDTGHHEIQLVVPVVGVHEEGAEVAQP